MQLKFSAARIAMAVVVIALISVSVISGAWAQSDADMAKRLGDRMIKQLEVVARLEREKKYGEAAARLKQLIATEEKALSGKAALPPRELYFFLFQLYATQSLFGEAEALMRGLLEKQVRLLGNDSAELIDTLKQLGLLFESQGKLQAAVSVFTQATRISELRFGADDRRTLGLLYSLGILHGKSREYAQASQLLSRAIAAHERSGGLGNVADLAVLFLAEAQSALGNHTDAERMYLRALEMMRKARGEDDATTLGAMHSIALFYADRGSYLQAMNLFDRVIKGRERTVGPDDLTTLGAILGLADLHGRQQAYAAAVPLYRRAYEANLRLRGPDDSSTIHSLGRLSQALLPLEEFGQAVPLLQKLMLSLERTTGRDSLQSTMAADSLALALRGLKQYGEAEKLYLRVINTPGLKERRLHALALDGLADIHYQQGNWTKAREFLNASNGEPANWDEMGAGQFAAELARDNRARLIRSASRIGAGAVPSNEYFAETFEAAQRLTQSEAALSIRRMAVRSLPRDGRLEAIIREYETVGAELQRLQTRQARLWNTTDLFISGTFTSEPGKSKSTVNTDRRNQLGAQESSAADIAALKAHTAKIDLLLAREFPQYGELVRPQPLSAVELQALLAPDEALVMFVDTVPDDPLPGETFTWVVTRTQHKWVRTDIDSASIAREVSALRCGLDREAWLAGDCANVSGGGYSQSDASAGVPLPFSGDRAHRLYRALFGQVQEVLSGKHLLIVPSGALTQLPFQVLQTDASSGTDHRRAAWLARKHATTVLPDVSSLKALRALGQGSSSRRPMVGFGNPLLDGNQTHKQDGEYHRRRAQQARAYQACSTATTQRKTDIGFPIRSVSQLNTRGGPIDPQVIRSQAPLPETADELCTVARSVNADPSDIYLGARATEREVKAMNARGELAQYRILHFATHGAMAGQAGPLTEPGLLLTPPNTASEEDDGYLSASEIAALKLDADWVLLSACNTAAGQAKNAQALSGIAKAFFYARARALMVSHWAVDTNAAVRLTTSALRETTRDRGVGRAEGLRRAMISLIDGGNAAEAHPAYWAPFVVVGDGAS